MRRVAVAVLLVLASGPLRSAASDQTTRDPRADLAGMLPPGLQEEGRTLLADTDPARRARRVRALAVAHPEEATAFLIALLEQEPAVAVRREIVDRLGRRAGPAVQVMLERVARSDRDAALSILALDRLRAQRQQQLRQLLALRYDQARAQGDAEAVRLLAQEQERWISLVRGTMLPAFLRTPPPTFSVADGPAIRVLAFGDYGTGAVTQRQVADAMLSYHQRARFDFGITLGDNFYDAGLPSPTDTRWRTWWDEMYAPLRLSIYATLGNHDWGLPDSPAAEILHTRDSPTWRMPAPYYTFTAGPAQFFALDTNEVSEAQLRWLDDALRASRARWRIVYGHHPIYSAGVHGDHEGLKARLLPLLRNRADVYLAGHDHDLQHLRADEGVHFFVSGTGGASIRPPTPNGSSLFAGAAFGFTVIEADGERLVLTFVGTDLRSIYAYALQTPPRANMRGPAPREPAQK
jgi:tartrate-resistant acid phosphatase type 5